MKITPKPTGLDNIAIVDSVVYIDEFHREYLGMDFIHDNCEVKNDLTASLKIKENQNLALVDSRPEVFTEVLKQASKFFDTPDFKLWCVFPKNHAEILEWIVEQPSVQNYAVRDYIISEQAVALVLGNPHPGDLDATTMFRGLELGLELTGQSLSASTDHSVELALREQLVAILRSLDTVNTEPSLPDEDEAILQTEPTEVSTSAADKQYIAELEGRIITLNKKLDALQRKYDALANSRVGKMMLNRWEKNRGQK